MTETSSAYEPDRLCLKRVYNASDLGLATLIVMTSMLLNSLGTLVPTHSISAQLLYPRLELCLVQVEVVNGSYTEDAIAWIACAASVQKSTAYRAKGVLHSITTSDSLILGPSCELLLTTKMLKIIVVYDEVRCKHRGCDLDGFSEVLLNFAVVIHLSAICTIADKYVNQSFSLCWLYHVSSEELYYKHNLLGLQMLAVPHHNSK